jgi:hypothetical protein
MRRATAPSGTPTRRTASSPPARTGRASRIGACAAAQLRRPCPGNGRAPQRGRRRSTSHPHRAVREASRCACDHSRRASRALSAFGTTAGVSVHRRQMLAPDEARLRSSALTSCSMPREAGVPGVRQPRRQEPRGRRVPRNSAALRLAPDQVVSGALSAVGAGAVARHLGEHAHDQQAAERVGHRGR